MEDETVRASKQEILNDTLAGVFDALAREPSSPHVRELRARAQTYERAVKEWAYRQPSPAQRAAMFDCVYELHEKVIELGRRSGRGSSLAPPSSSRKTG